jgi:hypothetical protein
MLEQGIGDPGDAPELPLDAPEPTLESSPSRTDLLERGLKEVEATAPLVAFLQAQ